MLLGDAAGMGSKNLPRRFSLHNPMPFEKFRQKYTIIMRSPYYFATTLRWLCQGFHKNEFVILYREGFLSDPVSRMHFER